ncbi:MAG: hypothetical protein JOZ67_11095 [Gammaproteobacteria bacterium]|nr:hypothetical protein [Gammaproteobacteria bacterium]MBV9698196.1 hypothetical protein [Gammaproteobacteria bacterium]
MEQIPISWSRALKIWWSYSWRASVLMLVVMVPLDVAFMTYTMTHAPTATTSAAGLQLAATMALAWPILMALVIALQAQAMRWMLRRARWSDFRVVLVPLPAGSAP